MENKKRVLETRFQVQPAEASSNATSIPRPVPTAPSTDTLISAAECSLIDNDSETQVNHENIIFVYLDLHSSFPPNLVTSLRAINDDVRIYTDPSTCFNLLESSSNRIFFISSSNDKELIKQVHDFAAVEAVFIVNSDAQIDKNRFSKLFGVYTHFEELLLALRNALEWFEQTQKELFVFQRDRIFLWSQLWKEEFMNPKISQMLSDKDTFINMAEKYYRENTKLLESLDDFDYCYDRSDALQWCFSSPFPSRFLHHALSSRNTKHLDLCHFLISDISRVLQQPSNLKSSRQFYRGMKLTNEFLDKLANHIGKLICPKGFFTCTKSRKVALQLAWPPTYRPDLKHVLFKIDCDPSVPIGELAMKDTSTLVVFDVFTAFRVKYVNRGSVSIVKLEPAEEDGRSIARGYRMRHRSENMKILLHQLSIIPKPPVQLLPIQRKPPPSESPAVSPKQIRSPTISKDELQAQKLEQSGKIDQALATYQRIKPDSSRVLLNMGLLYAEKKGDYDSAITCYEKALEIQEKNGEDITNTLNHLGIIHHNRQNFDLALEYHNRALNIRKAAHQIDQASVANSLIGVANAQWSQDNLSEALKNAQQALTLNESVESGNDLNISMNLAIIANIHHKSGDNVQALEAARRALTLLEYCVPPDSFALSSLLNNLGAIQMAVGSFSDARHSFIRALEICEKTLPQEHPKRVTMENNIQRATEMEQKYENNSTVQS